MKQLLHIRYVLALALPEPDRKKRKFQWFFTLHCCCIELSGFLIHTKNHTCTYGYSWMGTFVSLLSLFSSWKMPVSVRVWVSEHSFLGIISVLFRRCIWWWDDIRLRIHHSPIWSALLLYWDNWQMERKKNSDSDSDSLPQFPFSSLLHISFYFQLSASLLFPILFIHHDVIENLIRRLFPLFSQTRNRSQFEQHNKKHEKNKMNCRQCFVPFDWESVLSGPSNV